MTENFVAERDIKKSGSQNRQHDKRNSRSVKKSGRRNSSKVHSDAANTDEELETEQLELKFKSSPRNSKYKT
jgi:hypothetical protein